MIETANNAAGVGAASTALAGDANAEGVQGQGASATDGALQAPDGGQDGQSGAVSTEQSAQAGGNDDGQGDEASGKETETPAEYNDFVVPEGVTLDAELTGEFKEAALKAGLKQEQAQHLLDMGIKLQQKIIGQQLAALETQKTAWLDAVKSDREIGGDKLQENLAIAARAVNAFVSPALRELFDKTGLGNHPDMVKAFVKAGKLISEDSLVPGGTQPVTGGKTMAERLYPNQK